MKKILKWIIVTIPALLVLAITFIIISSYVEHRNLVEMEKERYPAPGILVDVNNDGNKLHIYAEGEGKETLVFMSGLGTSSPVYDFKVLYNKLLNNYRIAVVERAGYGWSDVTSSSRDVDTVLEETRSALQLSGESPPYVLFPHSLSGLEAIHWANLYPEEVLAIIGLDPLLPDYAIQTEEETTFSPVINILMVTGLVRAQPDIFNNNFPAAKKGLLTEEKTEIARTLFYRRVQTSNMEEELDMVKSNAQIVSNQGQIDVPFYAFISNENEDDYWRKSLVSYAKATDGEYFIMDAGHYIHLDKPGLIAEKSIKIIEKAIEN